MKTFKNFIFHKSFFTTILVLFFVFGFSSLNAANNPQVLIKTNKSSLPINDIVNVNINIDSAGNIINGVEGVLVYDVDNLVLEKVQIGDSFISLWIEKPNKENPGVVNFSGIIPGGIVLSDSNIFSLIFRAKENGQTNLIIKDLSLLINDGSGSSIDASVVGGSIDITGEPLSQMVSIDIVDNFAPNKFKINRSKDESLFDNRWFIVFDTQDKESGIDHYNVCEGFNSLCLKSNSPYLLNNQSAFYYIKVVAFDQNGNSQKSTLISPFYYAGLILILIGLLVFILKFFKKYK